MIAHPEVVHAVDACLIPFNVNSAAQAAAFAAFGQDDEISRRCALIATWRDEGAQLLRRRGLGVPHSQGNFWWLPAGDASLRLGAALERRGIVARPSPAGVRVTVGLPHENELFLVALDAAIADDPPLIADWALATGAAAAESAETIDGLVGATYTSNDERRNADRLSDAAAQR